jgi:pyrimidine operon attenuation protein/uracil phosphoribosyltransferase
VRADGFFCDVSTASIMNAAALERALTRMAHEIVENNPEPDSLVFIGIRTHGVPLAQRLSAKVSAILTREFPVGELDISMHRDDLALRHAPPQVGPSHISFDLTGKTIVLTDDVLFTGRTIRAAMDEINDFGRPRRIQLAILVDRGHRELPIRPDYVGKSVPTAEGERICVRLAEIDGKDEVVIER